MIAQGTGQRWRVLTNSKTQKSLLQSSRSTSKNKKYTPTRSGNVSQLQQKIKIGSESKLNLSEVGSNYRVNLGLQKATSNKNLEIGLYSKQQSSPLKSDRESFNNDNVNKNSINLNLNLNQELASPLIVMKQLNKVRRIETDRGPPTKALFSLDQEHRFIHNELHKIKVEFSKFKQLVEQQIVKQQQFMKIIVGKIYQQFDHVKQICNKCSSKVNTEIQGSTKDINIKNIQPFSLSLSEIKKVESNISQKMELKKVFHEESQNFQKVFNQKSKQIMLNENFANQENNNNIQYPLTFQKLRAKTERQQNNLLKKNNNSDKIKSKKQFEKLFEAVNCLKRDIKDLKGLSYQVTKQESHSRKLDMKQQQKKQAETFPIDKAKFRANLQKLSFPKNAKN